MNAEIKKKLIKLLETITEEYDEENPESLSDGECLDVVIDELADIIKNIP